MAALYEGSTLCGLALGQNSTESGIQGIELDGDDDHVVVTDSTRSVTVYKVSDQKALGSWTVKQGQSVTCPAVYNTQSREYVVVTDDKVIRVWKDDDINIDKVFKATVSADVYRVHSAPSSEPVVLFRRGAVRLLDSLLAAPQQPVEDVLSEEEVIRWSSVVTVEQQLFIVFVTEQKGEHLLYVQRLNPNTLVKYRLETEGPGSSPLSFSATFRDGGIHLLYLYPNGCVYQSLVQVRGMVPEGLQALPRTLLLKLPVGEEELVSASAVPLDAAHVAVVGVPHPSAGAGKDYLCIWNTNFQTLQAGKEMAGRIYGQLWCSSGKLYVPHGKVLSVIPFECQRSSLAAAMGKLKQAGHSESKFCAPVPSWNALPHGDDSQPQGSARGMQTRKNKLGRKSQAASALTVDQVIEQIKSASEEDVQREVEAFLSRTEQPDLQLAAGRLASQLVARCQAEPAFYSHNALVQLVHTQCLCHSVCPDLIMLGLERRDYSLCQFCLQLFPDIPEPITCACLKTFISAPDADLETVTLEEDSVAFVEGLSQSVGPAVEEGAQQNGFCPPSQEDDSCDAHLAPASKPQKGLEAPDMARPVGLRKAVLLNEVLQTPYTDSFLLPHLKDLTAPQVILFLQYLQFLYVKYSQDVNSQIPALRSPTMAQIMDWVCLLLDAHFTVLVLAPEAKSLLSGLHKFVRSQVKLYSELGKIQGSLQALQKSKQSEDVGQYSIEVIELF